MKNMYAPFKMKMISTLVKTFLMLIVMLSFQQKARASHAVGGAITYSWISGNTYEVNLVFYSDCGGITAGSVVSLSVNSASCGQSFNSILNLFSATEVTPICSGSQTTCSGGVLPGYRKNVYKGNITFPMQCNDWLISYSNCCRNGAITNLVNAPAAAIYLVSKLDNLTYPANNSPVFTNSSNFVFAQNSQQKLSLNAYDSDGDSLIYSLVNPLSGAGQPISFVSGLSANYPFYTTNSSVGFNSANGELNFTATSAQVAVLAMRVDEYRGGNHIGYVTTDIQLNIMAGSNSLPFINGIDSTGNYKHIAEAGDTVILNIPGYDMDNLQTATMTWDTAIASAQFTVSGSGNLPVGQFMWITDTTHISFMPYVFTVKIQDNNCPYYGMQSFSFLIWVNAVTNSSVWPGDANNDLIANNYDFLSLGIAYGNTGPTRPNASLNWVGQPAPNWAGSFASNVNHKFADCNGDGLIDTADGAAILINYGATHNKTGGIQSTSGPRLTLEYLNDSIEAGDTARAYIILGDTANPLTSFYGLAFTLQYDETLIDSGTVSVTFNPSWIGDPSTNLISIQKDFYGAGLIDVAVTRTNKISVSGSGSIGMLTHVMKDDIAGKQQLLAKTLQVNLQDGTAISEIEDRITLSLGADSIVVFQEESAVPLILPDNGIKVYPNPNSGSFSIETDGFAMFRLNIIDVAGRSISSKVFSPDRNLKVDISDIPSGIYFLEIYTEKGVFYKKIIHAGY